MTRPLTIEGNLKITRTIKGAKRLSIAHGNDSPAPKPLGRIPRIARLMALAIRWDGLIRDGAIKDYAEIAALCRVTRARVTQIMNLNLLAPDIQEAILFLPRVESGKDRLVLRNLQGICLTADWGRQRRMWRGYEFVR